MSFGEFTFAPRFHDRTTERQLPLQIDAGNSRRYTLDGQYADLLLDENDSAPSNSATLEDYIVHKPCHRRSKAWKSTELDYLADQSNQEADSPASSAVTTVETEGSSTSTITSQAQAQQTEDVGETNKSRTISDLGSYATNCGSPVFDYPRDVYGDDGTFRFCSISDGGLVVMQWSLVGMMWRNLGRIAAVKVQAFVEAVENMRAANTDNTGTTDKAHYVRGVEDLIHQIREGAASPVLRRHASGDNKSRSDPSQPSPPAAYKLSSAMEQAAQQTSEERRRLAQERGHLRRPNDDNFTPMRSGLLGYGGLAHNHTELARRTGTIDSLKAQVDQSMPRTLQRQQQQQQQQHNQGVRTPETSKRTVLHDPYKEQQQQQQPKATGVANQDTHVKQSRAPFHAANDGRPGSQDTVLGQLPRILTRAESARSPLSHLTDEEVRRMTPLVSNIHTNGPFFLADQDEQHVQEEKASYADELNLVWFSGLRVGRQYQRVASQRLAQLPEEQRNRHTEAVYRLLIPVFGQLRKYSNATKHQEKSSKGFSKSPPKPASWTSDGQAAAVKKELPGSARLRGLPIPPTPPIPFASSADSEPSPSGSKPHVPIPTGPKSLVAKRHGRGGAGSTAAAGSRRW